MIPGQIRSFLPVLRVNTGLPRDPAPAGRVKPDRAAFLYPCPSPIRVTHTRATADNRSSFFTQRERYY
jgi:hypothetical protein